MPATDYDLTRIVFLDPTSNRFGCHALVKSPWRVCGVDGMRWPVLLYDYAPRIESQKNKGI
jgi:hypothetical protein